MKDTDAAGAYKHLQEALDEVRNGVVRPAFRRMRFSEFAASLFERKVLKSEVESAQTRENWELMLRLHLFPTFGDVLVDAISIERRRGVAGRGGEEGEGRGVFTGDGE